MKKILISTALLLLVIKSASAYNFGVPRTIDTLPRWAQTKATEAVGFIENWIIYPDRMIWGNLRRIATSNIYYITDGISIGWVYVADCDPNSSNYDAICLFAYDGWNYHMWLISR